MAPSKEQQVEVAAGAATTGTTTTLDTSNTMATSKSHEQSQNELELTRGDSSQSVQLVCKAQPLETNNNHDLVSTRDESRDKAAVVVIETCPPQSSSCVADAPTNKLVATTASDSSGPGSGHANGSAQIHSELPISDSSLAASTSEQQTRHSRLLLNQSFAASQTAKTALELDQPQASAQFLKLKQSALNQQQQPANQILGATVTNQSGDEQVYPIPKRRRLSYLQALLLRRWPYLALTICIMSSLLFGMLLSALTVYLMHAHLSECVTGLVPVANHPHRAYLEPSSMSLQRGRADLSMEVPVESSSSGELEGRSVSSNGRVPFQRLPKSIWPIHYDLFIQPWIAEPFVFNGKVSIRIRCAESTNNITLHTNELDLNVASISLVELDPSDASAAAGQAKNSTSTISVERASTPKILDLSQDKQLQYSIVKLDGHLKPNREYLLSLDFTGSLNDDLAGFYKIKYQTRESNETTWIAATQFQATDARRAFPCFDEPLYKATFSIKIKHWKNMTALSNMPIVDSEVSSDGLWVTDTFGKTHRMSTYLVAYAVTNFESRREGNLSVWTRPGLSHTAEYALKIAGKILRHYEDFFGIEYPLPKMDMIALPDFNAGAMENWGLITYRETAMLYDDVASSVANKQRVAVVVAHELAHQWFGNLVTPKWWDDLWLNEGFASYVEYIGVDHVEPKWLMLDQFVTEEVHNVFKLDGLSTSHQISIPVNNPDEISEIFDHISYAKGASIIRMMSYFLTNQVFKQGLRTYLRALKYDNAEQSDLWAHLTEASRVALSNSSFVDVERVMNSWTLQTGFPLVTLTRRYGYGKARGASLEQVRYRSNFKTNNSSVLESVASNETASKNGTWEIPITYTWKSESNWEPNTRIWMHQEDRRLELNSSQVAPRDDEWMLVNINQVGYYRVNYDQRNWRLLVKQLFEDHQKIGLTNRAQMLDDMFEFARNGLLDYNFAMETTKYLKKEREFLAWNTVLSALTYVNDMLQRSPIYGDWRDYVTNLLTPYYNRYRDVEWIRDDKPGSDGSQAGNASVSQLVDHDDVLEQYNQAEAIAWGCELIESCVARAKQVFAEWRRTGINRIKPAFRLTTYCTSIEHGHKSDWDFLWQVYQREQNANERDRILRSLACSRELWILSRYLEWTFDKTKPIRRQDGSFVFRLIAANNYGRDVAFNFMRDRWPIIKEYYGKSSFALGSLVRSVGTTMNTRSELSQLIAFYESVKGDVGTGKRSFQNAIEQVEDNLLWRERNYKTIENWIAEQSKSFNEA